MMHRSRSFSLLGAFLVLGCMEAPPSGTRQPSRSPPGSGGKLAPEIAGQDAFGNSMRLSEFRGKVVLLEFWRTA